MNVAPAYRIRSTRWPSICRILISVALIGVLGPAMENPATHPQGALAAEPTESSPEQGLIALYEFRATGGPTVHDQSGVSPPVDLTIEQMSAVRWTAEGLKILGKTRIGSTSAAKRIVQAIRQGEALTVELWVEPADLRQTGPARIITLSKDPTNRNFTVGQDADAWEIRLRTTDTSANGIPAVRTRASSVQRRLTHVVYVRHRDGRVAVYLNGQPHLRQQVAGSLANWDESFRLTLANEQDGSRPWLGTYRRIALYSRPLDYRELLQHYQAGPSVSGSHTNNVASDRRGEFFQTRVAPLLAKHCLECHDSVTREGSLDLSRKTTALAGGENGEAIIANAAGNSLLWQLVDTDEMPSERPHLSSEEKEILRKWIDDGAVWSLERIDPAIYVHGDQASENWLRRLTVAEYIETVRHAVGVDIEPEARNLLPADLRADGFSNTAYNLNVDLKHVKAYAELAEIIVQRMDVGKYADQFGKNRRFTDDAMGKLISRMGAWLLRGPVSEREIIAYRGISTTVASSGGSYDEAVGHIIEAMLQSPRFLYRVENQRGDGSLWPATQHELASRLSYIIWGGPPDHALLRAASDNRLSTPAEIQGQVERMLKNPRAVEHSLRFVADWLHLDHLRHLQPNAERYPDWNPSLAEDMRQETLAFAREILWRKHRPVAELLNAQVTYATPRLAKHYGLRSVGEPSQAAGSLLRYELTSDPARGGLLTQGSLLTVGGDEASMVTRGLLVMHEFLRGVVKDPPPCVDTTPVPSRPGLTQRAIATQRIASRNCGGCHAKFEPLAFGLEKFDGLGTFAETDRHGNRLREDGQLLIPGESEVVSYATAAELMDLLAQSERVQESITWKLTQFAIGRPLVAADAAIVSQIHRTAQQAGGTYDSLIQAIVLSDLVQKTRTERDSVNAAP